MTSKELISQFPKKLFSEVFEDRKKELLSRGANEKDIKNHKDSYQKLFELENLLIEVKINLELNLELEISSYIEQRIGFFIKQINQFVDWINGINTAAFGNINKVFQPFKAQIDASNLMQNIQFQIVVGNSIIGMTLIDQYISELMIINQSLQKQDTTIKELDEIAAKLLDNKDNLSEAFEIAENFRKSQKAGVSISVEDKAAIFNIKADEHKVIEIKWKQIFPTKNKFWGWMRYPSGTYIWMIFAVIFGFISMMVIFYFAEETKGINDLSVGLALIRISALIVPSYFSFFCAQRFLHHQKLYEFYKFKAVALTTMDELYKAYANPKEQELILNKAVSIIFLEPPINDGKSSISEKEMINHLIDVSKNKFP